MKRTVFTLALATAAIVASAQLPPCDSTDGSTEWIRQIIPDGDGRLWIATEGGLANYDKTTGSTTLYTAENAGLPGNDICSLFADGDDLWLGTKFNGVARMNGGSLVAAYNQTNCSLETDQYFCSIARCGERLVFGSLLGNNIFDGDDFLYIRTPNGEISAFIGFNAIAEDSHGTLWVGGYDALGRESLCYLNEDQELVPVTAPHHITGMFFDEHDVLWMATDHDGMARFDGQSITRYTPENSQMTSAHTYCISHDAAGNIWISTGKSLICFDGTSFNQIDIPLAEDDWIFTFLIDGSRKWIGTRRSGLYLLEDGRLTKRQFGEQPDDSDFIIPTLSAASYRCETTAISSVSMKSPNDDAIYNLQGQRLSSEPQRGLFIKNRKKIVKQ